MRSAWLAILLVPSLAAAEPVSTRCYAGDQIVKSRGRTTTHKVVLERTLDPEVSELRERAWGSSDPAKEGRLTAKIDIKTNTFEFEFDSGENGKGSLEGRPWHWTRLSLKYTRGKTEVAATSSVDGQTVHSQAAAVAGGKPLFTLTAELANFDCEKLDEQRAALAK